jgi:hypothetical protein
MSEHYNKLIKKIYQFNELLSDRDVDNVLFQSIEERIKNHFIYAVATDSISSEEIKDIASRINTLINFFEDYDKSY